MATASITITITTPVGVTAGEALRLFTDALGYSDTVRGIMGETMPNPLTRIQVAQAAIASHVKSIIKNRQQYEAQLSTVLPDITVA